MVWFNRLPHFSELPLLSSGGYIDLVQKRQRSPFHYKILNDAHRTLAKDTQFTNRVSSQQLTRVLNASVLLLMDGGFEFSYVQGMNVLLAPFLFELGELNAVNCFARFLCGVCPTYVQPDLRGVHVAIEIFDRLFQLVDSQLYSFLKGKNVTSHVFVFSPLMTFCASMTPLDEVVRLWDFYMEFGFHYNVLVVLSHLVMARDVVMKCETPSNLLRTNWAPLKAKALIKAALVLGAALPRETIEILKSHLIE